MSISTYSQDGCSTPDTGSVDSVSTFSEGNGSTTDTASVYGVSTCSEGSVSTPDTAPVYCVSTRTCSPGSDSKTNTSSEEIRSSADSADEVLEVCFTLRFLLYRCFSPPAFLTCSCQEAYISEASGAAPARGLHIVRKYLRFNVS